MTGLDLAVAEELSRSFEPCLSNQRCTSWLAGDDVRMMALLACSARARRARLEKFCPSFCATLFLVQKINSKQRHRGMKTSFSHRFSRLIITMKRQKNS